MFQSYNFLIIGRSGSGKSATTKFLTGDQTIKVMFSPNEVTTKISFYNSTKYKMEQTKLNIGVLDIPGLDELANRKIVRQLILKELEQHNIEIDGILYTIDCVARDTVNNKKIFNFLNDLPWSFRDTREHLYPILTKYDNLIFDGNDQNTKQTFQEFSQIFEANQYGESWKYNRLYWVNDTKNIEKKMGYYNEIKQTYESQVYKLISMVKKNKNKLSVNKIRIFLQEEALYLEKKIKFIIRNKETALRRLTCTLVTTVHIQRQPKNNIQNATAVTLGGMGVFLAIFTKGDLAKGALSLTTLIAGGILAKNIISEYSTIKDLKPENNHQLQLNYKKNYIIEKYFELINRKLIDYQKLTVFSVRGDRLTVKLPNSLEYEPEYFFIDRKIVKCIIDQLDLEPKENWTFQYPLKDVAHKVVETIEVKFKIQITVPQQNLLLEMFQKESFNFKKEFDQKINQL